MENIFFLSIHNEYAELILSGDKKWEFRENLNFGILDKKRLSEGDMFL